MGKKNEIKLKNRKVVALPEKGLKSTMSIKKLESQVFKQHRTLVNWRIKLKAVLAGVEGMEQKGGQDGVGFRRFLWQVMFAQQNISNNVD